MVATKGEVWILVTLKAWKMHSLGLLHTYN